jgi:hypothetical protein
LSKLLKCSTVFLLMLLGSAAFLLVMTPTINAQDDLGPPVPDVPPAPSQDVAKVVVLASVGGTTDPSYGEYTYSNSTKFEILATPNAGFRFDHWVISGDYLPGHNLPQIIVPNPLPEDWVPQLPTPSDLQKDSLVSSQNPLSVICGYGYTYQYQPIFVPTSTPGSTVTGTVVVLSGVGGSVNPGAGTYTYAGDQIVTLTATADSGFEFDHWVISGGPMPGHGDLENDMTTDNPFTTHAVQGETYNYQPVFSPTGTTTGGGGIPTEYLYAIIIVLAIIAIIGLGAALLYRGKSKGGT